MGVASNRVDVKQAGGPGRAHPRAAGRAALGAVPPGRPLAPGVPRPGVAPGRARRRPRLRLRLLGRRGRRRRARPLRRRRRHRRRPRGTGGRRPLARRSPARARPSSTPRPGARAGLVELALPGAAPPGHPADLRRRRHHGWSTGLTRRECVQVVQRALDEHPNMHRAEAAVDADGVLASPSSTTRRGATTATPGSLKADVTALADADPAGPATVAIAAPPSQRVLARVEVPALGWARWDATPSRLGRPGDGDPDGRRRRGVGNGLVVVEVDPADGTFALADPVGQRGHPGPRPPRRRRRRRRHLQLVATGRRALARRRPARLGRRCDCSSRARCGPASRSAPPTGCPRRWSTAAGRRGGDRGRDHPRAAGRLAARDGHDRARQPQPRPPAPDLAPAAPSGPPPRTPSAPSPSSTGAPSPRAARPSGRWPPTRRAASSPPAASSSCTRACSSTSSSTSTSSAAAGPTLAPSPSPCCAAPACSRRGR